MSEGLKSAVFRREREATWRRLQSLVRKAEEKGLRALTTEELIALPQLYRATLASLSVARDVSLDASLIAYLENLSLRAHLFVYAVRETFGQAVNGFFGETLPRAVRAAVAHVVLAGAALALGATVAYALVMGSDEWFYAFVPEHLAGGRTPDADVEHLRSTLAGGGGGEGGLAIYATSLFVHNAGIGLFAFALGFAAGVPTLALLFYNGAVLGAFIALFVSRGLGAEMAGWLTIHGATELFAVILCGAAGLMVAGAALFPGDRRRLDAMAETGHQAAVVAAGAVPLFFAAGLLEGFGRQLIEDTGTRLAIGLGIFGLTITYLALAGRERR